MNSLALAPRGKLTECNPGVKFHDGDIAMIRVGTLGWRLLARLGCRMFLRVDVMHDQEAGVYVATSPDLLGLTVEVDDLAQLIPEVNDCVGMLIEQELKRAPRQLPRVAYDGHLMPA